MSLNRVRYQRAKVLVKLLVTPAAGALRKAPFTSGNYRRSVHAGHATMEQTMPVICFEKPVSIFVGLGFPREVESIWDAFVVLNEWPTRGPAHEAVLNACRAGMNGKFDAETIRDAFEAFAREAGILMPDALERSAHISTSSVSRPAASPQWR
jgi:hypothetical protein